MGQLTKEQADQLWPEKSQKIYFLCHTLNDDEKALLRCILSVRDLADKIVVLVDDKAACIVPAIVDYATSLCFFRYISEIFRFYRLFFLAELLVILS